MADAVSHTSEPKKLQADQVTPANSPGKFYSSFLYKAAIVTVFLVLFPLFPSMAPEFVNPILHARSWELLQLIFVGIAVSYGLFSKRNQETEKDHGGSNLDNAQSVVTKLLQVSSVFDDESESQTIIQENNQVETLNSKYYRGEPVVVVAKPSPIVVKEENGCEISQKPLLLPVRSLKHRIAPEANALDLGNESGPRNREVGGLSFEKLDDKLDEEVVVLRSPVPWRSRSGRMEMKEKDDIDSNGIDGSTSFKSSSKNSSTPRKSFESQAKSSEDDVVRKRNDISSSPPPAPPPPTASQFFRKSVLSKSNSILTGNAVSPEKVLRRSTTSVPTENLSGSEMEELPRCRIHNDVLAKSVRTYRFDESEKKSMDHETKFVDKKGYTDKISNGKFPEESSDQDTEAESADEEEYFEGIRSRNGEAATTDNNNKNSSVTDVGLDVDKKADAFIAKFREQIRLQRIESIRRSAAPRL